MPAASRSDLGEEHFMVPVLDHEIEALVGLLGIEPNRKAVMLAPVGDDARGARRLQERVVPVTRLEVDFESSPLNGLGRALG